MDTSWFLHVIISHRGRLPDVGPGTHHLKMCDVDLKAETFYEQRVSEIYPVTHWPTAAPEESQQARGVAW